MGGILALVLGGATAAFAAGAPPPRSIGCQSASYGGQHDVANCQMVHGWAWQPSLPNTPISVDVLIDGFLAATLKADFFRDDLPPAGIGDGRHAFVYAVPARYKDNQTHSARVRISGTTFSLVNTPLTFGACPAFAGDFFTLAPCRVVDTRLADGPYGGPAIMAGTTRLFQVGGACGIPLGAQAVSLNVTIITAGVDGHLRVMPGGVGLPIATTLSFGTGLTRANNAVLELGLDYLTVYCDQPTGSCQVVIDVNGYFI
jgi:hypothetical protein